VEHATPSSGSQSPEANISTIMSGGGSQRLTHAVDNSRAMELHATPSLGSQSPGPEANICTIMSSGGSQRLARAMGKSCAMVLMLTGHGLDDKGY